MFSPPRMMMSFLRSVIARHAGGDRRMLGRAVLAIAENTAFGAAPDQIQRYVGRAGAVVAQRGNVDGVRIGGVEQRLQEIGHAAGGADAMTLDDARDFQRLPAIGENDIAAVGPVTVVDIRDQRGDMTERPRAASV
jgi:hypothetical protein